MNKKEMTKADIFSRDMELFLKRYKKLFGEKACEHIFPYETKPFRFWTIKKALFNLSTWKEMGKVNYSNPHYPYECMARGQEKNCRYNKYLEDFPKKSCLNNMNNRCIGYFAHLDSRERYLKRLGIKLPKTVIFITKKEG